MSQRPVRVLTGITTSGTPHLGNYVGAIRPAIAASQAADVETQVDEPLSGLRAEASCGPIGQVDVPTPGRYRISASYAGERQEHWVDLAPQGGARLSLRWQE